MSIAKFGFKGLSTFFLRLDSFTFYCFLIGLVLRLLPYLSGRSLWIDEAMLVHEILNKSWIDLLGPLGLHQAAPIGYLLLMKLAVSVFGDSEYSLRFYSFVFGVLFLYVFFDLAKIWFRSHLIGFRIAILFTVFSPPLIYYSSEVKPYIADAFITVYVLRYFRWKSTLNSPVMRIIFVLLGMGFITISFSCVLILSSVILFWLWSILNPIPMRKISSIATMIKRVVFYRNNLFWICFCAGIWGLTFLTQLHLVGRYYLKDEYLLQFWQSARFHSISAIFNDYIGNYLYNVHFYLWGAELPLAFLGGFVLIFVITALFGYSIRTICYVGRWMVGVILLAWIFTQFVFIDRLGLFFIPIFILLYSSLCKFEKNQKISPRIITTLLLLPLVFPVFWSIRNLTVLQDPIMKCRQPIKLVLKEINTEIRDQDLIFVFSPTRYAFDYHTRLWKIRPQIVYGDTLEELPILFRGRIYFVITYTADREKMSPILKAAKKQRGNLRLISAHSNAEVFVSDY